jgi:hypothetical protein
VGVFAGPKVVEDGLVLSLDPGNIFKSVDSTSNNFLQNGSFAGGLGVTYEEGSNPTNTIIELENPGDSNYVLRQNGNNTEYQMNIDGGAQGTLSASTQYVMSGWYATSDDYNGGDTMFHARAYSTGGSHNATGNGIGTLLYSVEIGGLTWEYRYQTITTPSDYSGNFDWYMGYGTTNTTGYRYYTGLKVEQGSFPSLLDLSRNGNDAKVINGTSYSSANGGSLVFDGVDDYIQTDITTHYPNITLEAWARRTDTNSFRSLIGKYRGDPAQTESYELLFNSSAGIRFHVTSSSINYDSSTVADTWYHVVGTYDGTTARIYLNGEAVASGSRTAGSNSVPFRVGASPRGANYNNGNIARASIYNRALTASEVKQNFNALRGRFGI